MVGGPSVFPLREGPVSEGTFDVALGAWEVDGFTLSGRLFGELVGQFVAPVTAVGRDVQGNDSRWPAIDHLAKEGGA